MGGATTSGRRTVQEGESITSVCCAPRPRIGRLWLHTALRAAFTCLIIQTQHAARRVSSAQYGGTRPQSSVYLSHHTDAARSTARLLCTVWRHTASEQRFPVSSYRRSTQHGASPMHGNYLHLHLHLCGRCPLGFGVMSDLYIFIIFFSVCCHTTGTPPGAAGAAPGPRGT